MISNRITKPTLIIDENICRRNIREMAMKCRQSGAVFRPHFKTHQSADIGEWFREEGIDRITVSSVQMAEYFARCGWKDILIAFPVNIPEIAGINKLAATIELHLLVESTEVVRYLIKNLNHSAGIYIKIDTGHHRTGILPDDLKTISEITSLIDKAPNLKFTGFLTHSGNTYLAQTRTEIIKIHNDSKDQLYRLKQHFFPEFPGLIISTGDTPSCSIVTDFQGLNEIRPGNFVFYDLMQVELGSCNFSDIAAILACPVVAKNPDRNEIVVYGGAIHLSKEYLIDNSGAKSYGRIVRFTGNGWTDPLPETCVSSLSQEHGIIKSSPSFIGSIRHGDILGIVPVHSCLTANQHKKYLTTGGKVVTSINY